MYILYYLIIKNVFLKFTKLDIFPLHITEGMNKHGAANPQSRILGKRVSLKSFSACTLFPLLHTSSNNIFLSSKSPGLRVGERGLLHHPSPLHGVNSQNLGGVVENHQSEICTPPHFLKASVFAPQERVVKSLKFNI